MHHADEESGGQREVVCADCHERAKVGKSGAWPRQERVSKANTPCGEGEITKYSYSSDDRSE